MDSSCNNDVQCERQYRLEVGGGGVDNNNHKGNIGIGCVCG
jgi:hypothetical protein